MGRCGMKDCLLVKNISTEGLDNDKLNHFACHASTLTVRDLSRRRRNTAPDVDACSLAEKLQAAATNDSEEKERRLLEAGAEINAPGGFVFKHGQRDPASYLHIEGLCLQSVATKQKYGLYGIIFCFETAHFYL